MKKFINNLLVSVGLFAVVAPSALAFNLFSNNTCQTANGHTSSICAAQPGNTNPVAHTLQVTADILALIAGIIAVIMIIISGLTMITSQGNADSVKTSRSRIIYAVVGLIIIGLAWSITTLISNHLA